MARSPDGAWLATLTASSLCIWSARQHRVVLGHYPRHPSSLESDGENVRLCWHPDSHTLAVSTAGSFVYLYQVQEANSGASTPEHPSSLSAEDCARLLRGQFHVSISLTQKVQAAVQEGAATGALAASSAHFWLGVARGVLLAIDWSAQDPTPRKLHLRPPASQQEPDSSAAVTAVCCAAKLDFVVGLDADGRAGYSFGCEEYSGEVATTASALLLPSERGTSLSVSVGQRLLCVGCASGALLLFRIGVEEGRQGADFVHESAAPAPKEIRLERKLTLSPWGISPEECGAVVAVDWSDDGLGLAAVWDCRSSPGIWSPLSGACTFVPPANDFSALAPSDTSRRASTTGHRRHLMPCALAWAENGLALWTAVGVRASDDCTSEDGPTRSDGGLLSETVLVQPCASRGPCQNEAARRCFYTHNRVLMLTQHNFVATGQTQPWSTAGNRDENVSVTKKTVSAVDTKFVWRELAVPWKYLADNWPVRHVSASTDGTQLAVSGARGLTLLDLRTKRWRVFGDVTQERELDCVGLAWFRHIVIVYAITEEYPVQDNIWGDSNRQASSSVQVVQLHLYPRKHLDRSSRLFSPASLPAPPHCVDVDERTGVLATLCKDGSLILHQLWLQHEEGDDDQNLASDSGSHNSEAMALRAVTLLADCRLGWAVASDLGDLTVQKMRLAPAALILPCPIPFASTLPDMDGNHESDSVDASGALHAASAARRTRAGQLANSTAAGIASLCLMLYRGGRLELYDAISGVRLRVATNVGDFWLTPVSSLPFQDVAALPLLWYCDSTGRLSVCRTGDLAKNWAAAVAAHRAHLGGESTSAVQTRRAMHCWGDKQDASEAWTVGLSEHYGVLLRVSALHWSGSDARPRRRDTLAASVLGYGDQGCGLVINQSPVLHRLFESLLTPTSDNSKGEQETDTEAATVAATAGNAACAAICQRCSPAWPSLAASLEWLLHGALETVGTKVKKPFEGANAHATTTLDVPVHGMNTLLSRVLQVLRCFPEEYEGIIGRCARTMDPAYWAPLFQDPPLGAGQPSLLFEACLQHTPPQLRNAAHYLIILQTTLPNSGQSASENWQTYPPRLVEMALATGEYSLVTEVLQFLRRAEAYANAAAEYNAKPTGTTTSSQVEIHLSPRRSAFGRVPTAHEVMNESESAPSPTAVETIGGKVGGWLEFLGFVDSSTSAGAEAMQRKHTESEPQLQQHAPELQQESTEADHNGTDSNHASLIQTRIVPLVEAHALGLLQELRLSELVRCVDAAAGTDGRSSHSEFQLGSWLRRLDKGELATLAEVVEDFGASLRTVATMMEHDRRRQKELRCGQRPGSMVVAEDVEEEAPGDADGTASSMPNPCAVRELGHCLAAAGLVDLGLLLPTVCGDAVGAADILRAATPQGYDRYDAYASGLLRFVLGPTPGHTGKPAAGSTTTTVEAERQVMIFLDRLTESSLPTTCGPGHPRTPTDTDSR